MCPLRGLSQQEGSRHETQVRGRPLIQAFRSGAVKLLVCGQAVHKLEQLLSLQNS
jgi:hypothetical protein